MSYAALTLPCPHSSLVDPHDCSQCLGVRPKMITRDVNGALMIDGVIVVRDLMPKQKYTTKTGARKKAKLAT